MSNMVECTELGSFRSYGVKPISTAKPGTQNYYIKDVYKDISDFHRKKIGYLEDRIRKNTVYENDILKSIRDTAYVEEQNQNKIKTLKYEYSHDEDIKNIAINGNKKDESQIKEKFFETNKSLNRKKMFSNWDSTYDSANEQMFRTLSQKGLNQDGIKDWFKNTYHNYQRGSYNTESLKAFGVLGDVPAQKYSGNRNNPQIENKLYNDCFDLNLGTSKTSTYIPGYSGYIPVNNLPLKNTTENDPYFRTSKTNHQLTYNIRLPGYKGYIPQNPQNIKGNTRPVCLSTEGETFN